MEHLELPADRALAPASRLCKAPEPIAIGTDPVERFVEYPSKAGWKRIGGRWTRTIASTKRDLPETSLFDPLRDYQDDLSQFVQRWLFFELLHAMFHNDDNLAWNSFIDARDGQLFVSTRQLNGFILRWQSDVRSDITSYVSRILQAQHILVMARSETSKLCHPTKVVDIWAYREPIDEEVALQVLVLGETLTKAVLDLSLIVDSYPYGWRHHILSTQSWGHSALLLQKLSGTSRRGCQRLNGIIKPFSSTNVGLLLADLYAPMHLDHSLCTPERCRAHDKAALEQLVSQTVAQNQSHSEDLDVLLTSLTSNASRPPQLRHYRELATHSTCQCSLHSVNDDVLQNIYDGGSWPLISFNQEAGLIGMIYFLQCCTAGAAL